MDGNANQVPQETYGSPGFPFKKILSLLIGVLVIIAVIASVILFVLPRTGLKQSGDVTLNYWLVFEDPGPFRELAQEFTKKNPHISINIEKKDIKSDKKEIQRLTTQIGNGEGPDVFRFHISWLPEVIRLLAPLPQDVVSATQLDTKFYPTVSRDLKVNGAYYGIPIHFDTLALFINTDLYKASQMDSYPSTWDDLIKASNNITVKDDKGKIITSGIALGSYDNVAHASDIISLLLLQNGADLLNLNGPTKDNAAAALQYYTLFATGDTKVWDPGFENSKLAFAGGKKVAMYIGYSWDVFEIKARNPNLKFAIVPVPYIPAIPPRKDTVASYWVEGVSNKTAHPKEAFEFLKFLASKESMEKLYSAESKTRLFGEIYPRSDMADLFKNNSLVHPFVERASDAKSTIFSSDTYDDGIVDQINKYMGDAINSIITNNSSPQSAVFTLGNGVAQKLGTGKK